MKKIPEQIKDKRNQLKESQATFGKRFGVSHASVSGWENGKVQAPYKVIEFVHDCEKAQKIILTCNCNCNSNWFYSVS